MRRVLFALAAGVAAIAASTAISPAASHARRAAPIAVKACNPQAVAGFVPARYPFSPFFWNDVYGNRYNQPAIAPDATLSIDYVNVSHQPITAVEFGLLARGALVAEVRDVGTFSPGIEIRHEFGLNPNVFPIGTGLPVCEPLRATYRDGTTWVNPHLPALRRTIYR